MNDKTKSSMQFVDTNVLVYAYDVNAGVKRKSAEALISELWETRKGCLSVQVLQEFYAAITKKVLSPIKPETAAGIIADYGEWIVHSPDVDDILKAIEIQSKYNLSFWDSMIISSAYSLNCDMIWAEDLNNGQSYENIQIINPFLAR